MGEPMRSAAVVGAGVIGLATARELLRRGWHVRPDSPARQSLAEVLATLNHVGGADFTALLDDYAAAAEKLAKKEVPAILERGEVDDMGEAMVIGTVVADALLAALRRLALESEAVKRLQA